MNNNMKTGLRLPQTGEHRATKDVVLPPSFPYYWYFFGTNEI
jgi:hypothetical protein